MFVLGDDQIVSYSADDAYGEEFPEEFKKYMGEELSWSRCENKLGKFWWIFWSRDADKLERSRDSPYCNLEFEKKIRHALELIKLQSIALLIQYWVPIIIDDRCEISTRNQPFFLNYSHEGLCGYRMISKAYNFFVDGKSEEELGLPGRVFLNKLPESTPNVKYYSSKEYPQRDDALRHNVRASLALPVFDAFDQSCVGVLELEVGLNCSVVHNHPYKLDSNRNEAFTAAKDEIENVLEEVCKANDLRLAQAWVPCNLCNPVVSGIPGVSYSTGQVVSTIASLFYVEDTDDELFIYACQDFHLRTGQGVVGAALLSSTNMLFCTDVTQFSMSEYPFVHHARDNELSGCFAICLQSSHTGNDIYLLEFFLDLHDSNRSDGELQTLLHNIVRTMKQSFETLKLASGEELGEELPIDVIDFHNGEKRFSQIPPTIRSPPRPTESLQNRPAASAEQISDIAVTCPQERSSLRPKSTTGIQISLEDLLQHAGMKLKNAAESLKVSRSTFKRICREHNIPRWPPRNIKKDNPSLPAEESVFQGVAQEQILQSSSDPPSKQVSAAHDTPMQDANYFVVTIKAKFVNGLIIKFDLSLPPKLVKLQQQVAERLDLEDGTYYIRYEDEDNDLILITRDEDLENCIRTRRSLGNTSIVVLVDPKEYNYPLSVEEFEKVGSLDFLFKKT